uniref:Uncharacterized protein n=1 Tax=Lepeophtheirus salmonis TaxID=72036 RepID=A0A0K2UMB5_LEPSM
MTSPNIHFFKMEMKCSEMNFVGNEFTRKVIIRKDKTGNVII